jgi:hypothetical protein
MKHPYPSPQWRFYNVLFKLQASLRQIVRRRRPEQVALWRSRMLRGYSHDGFLVLRRGTVSGRDGFRPQTEALRATCCRRSAAKTTQIIHSCSLIGPPSLAIRVMMRHPRWRRGRPWAGEADCCRGRSRYLASLRRERLHAILAPLFIDRGNHLEYDFVKGIRCLDLRPPGQRRQVGDSRAFAMQRC